MGLEDSTHPTALVCFLSINQDWTLGRRRSLCRVGFLGNLLLFLADGPGPDHFGEVGRLTFEDPTHSLDASLEQWVEKGKAPGAVIASKYQEKDQPHATMTRPLCPYPQAAKYKGSGDTKEAGFFACAAAKK